MACYALFALLGYFQLSGMPRTALWIFLGGLAVKTWIHARRAGQ